MTDVFSRILTHFYDRTMYKESLLFFLLVSVGELICTDCFLERRRINSVCWFVSSRRRLCDGLALGQSPRKVVSIQSLKPWFVKLILVKFFYIDLVFSVTLQNFSKSLIFILIVRNVILTEIKFSTTYSWSILLVVTTPNGQESHEMFSKFRLAVF